MLHEDKDEFLRVLERASAQTGFPQALLEKDYYLTLILSRINSLSGDLLFKGGTCLNKVHYSYYRLSEDLDFTMRLPDGTINRNIRKATIEPVKSKLKGFARPLGMNVETEKAGHKESSQYIYHLYYDSALLNSQQSIKLEIALRFNPSLPPETKAVKHKFLHPFTNEPLFDGGQVQCLNLKELVAEKLRAASTRITIAPRDFYDLGYLQKAGFDFNNAELHKLFQTKLAEDGFDTNLLKYRINLGRTNNEIEEMNSRTQAELMDVLTLEEKNSFNMVKTLESLNNTFKNLR
jgi:predicted nucleotidyltransferase component of viral defense system